MGRRFPSNTGIAGWALASRQPLVIEDVAADPHFARELAESTGYIPQALMAVPLLREERALGVLEVLDRPQRAQATLAEIELLALFASQAANALDLLLKVRRARQALAGEGRNAALVRLAEALERVEDHAAVDRLLAALAEIVTGIA